MMFGGERFVPIIGHISLAKDMKTAMQEADDIDESKPVQRDAKGREILSPEEKAKRDEKARKIAAEVRPYVLFMLGARSTSDAESGGARRAGTEARGESGAEARDLL